MAVQVHGDVGEGGHERDGALRGAAQDGHHAAVVPAADREEGDQERHAEDEGKMHIDVKGTGNPRIRKLRKRKKSRNHFLTFFSKQIWGLILVGSRES